MTFSNFFDFFHRRFVIIQLYGMFSGHVRAHHLKDAISFNGTGKAIPVGIAVPIRPCCLIAPSKLTMNGPTKSQFVSIFAFPLRRSWNAIGDSLPKLLRM